MRKNYTREKAVSIWFREKLQQWYSTREDKGGGAKKKEAVNAGEQKPGVLETDTYK